MADASPFRLIILGAGFSAPAGYPLADELWKEIMRRARRLGGRAKKFDSDLSSYLEYKTRCEGIELGEDEVDVEDFCRFLDIEHFLGLRGFDTWSNDGNEGTVVVKTLLGTILAEYTPPAGAIPQVYLDFARRLKPLDYVLTFNYDTLLELALDDVGTPYRLFPSRYEEANEFGATVDLSREEVVVLKLHGSIDWFDRTTYAAVEQKRRELGLTSRGDDQVFGPPGDKLGVAKLLDGPRAPADPLNEMYRVRDIQSLYSGIRMFLTTPWLLAPSTMQILYAEKLADFWYGLGEAGIANGGMAIIGYSLPRQDEYAHQVVYRIVNNYQSKDNRGEEILGRPKDRLVMIDLRADDAGVRDFRERYGFVDWSRAVEYYGGLDSASLDLIFRRQP